MAVKGGQILHDAYGFVIERIQTGGVTGLNVAEEKIYELGNFHAVATVRDIPDLTFDLECYDFSTEVEALLGFIDPTTTVSGTAFDLSAGVPMDIISPIKDSWNVYNASHGVAIPWLTLESASYRFDLKGNASARHTLRGDSYFFTDGAPYYEEFAGNGVTATHAVTHGPALPYEYLGRTFYMLGLSVVYADMTSKRLFLGDDFTNTSAGFTLLNPTVAPTGSTIRAVYGSATVANYPQSVHSPTSVKPAAVRGRNVDIYVGTNAATPTFTRWRGVQSAEVNFRLRLDKDEEFGNAMAVSQDHDVPEVSGNIVIKPTDLDDLWARVHQVSNVASGHIAGPSTSTTVPVEFRVTDPDTGVRLMTLYVPDARFKTPAIDGRVQTKLTPTFEYSSDGGQMMIYKGNRPGT